MFTHLLTSEIVAVTLMLFDKLLTTKEVAAVLRVHVQTVLSAIHRGRLKASKFGRTYRVRPDDLEKLINRHTSL